MDPSQPPVKRIVLRAVLKGVSPLVARVLSVSDSLALRHFHEAFLAVLGWRSDPDFIIRVHGRDTSRPRRHARRSHRSDRSCWCASGMADTVCRSPRCTRPSASTSPEADRGPGPGRRRGRRQAARARYPHGPRVSEAREEDLMADADLSEKEAQKLIKSAQSTLKLLE